MLIVFDLLCFEGQDLRHEPLHIRRDRVERVLDRVPTVLLPARRLADHCRSRTRDFYLCTRDSHPLPAVGGAEREKENADLTSK